MTYTLSNMEIHELHAILNDLNLMLVQRLDAEHELESRSYICEGTDGNKTINYEGN